MSQEEAKQKVVLVTGCSAGGIGHHLALEFAAHGCRVYATARNRQRLELSSANITPLELDVTSQESVQQAVDTILKDCGRINVVVNNAGQLCIGPATEVSIAEAQSVFDTNVLGAMRVSQTAVPHMAPHSTIVNVGSVSGYTASPWAGYYAASKAALHKLSDAMRMELSPFDINVVVLAPGAIKSNLAKNTNIHLREGSVFSRARSDIERRARHSQCEGATPADRFAREVVPLLLRNRPPAYISRGHLAVRMFLAYYFPAWLGDYVVGRPFMRGLTGARPSSRLSWLVAAGVLLAFAMAAVKYSN
ncbi:hypothetical protein GGI25_004573 [Coemansia spiralis]|uniref:Ketoreductase domain-containing protein n=2 Tax=Coemansia TaxID=4863 RepID=A0A9W8KX34_9FUNG|nr:hypothetical protein EDC05_004358 [Coemansia umbellata]KAJ2620637.1 hypothetical protein GGI26_004799 [Coemansia sp. RSA 1358]KAJ2673826.1 hypothetical protein GGI25_004573 [Coemansia spiralis]